MVWQAQKPSFRVFLLIYPLCGQLSYPCIGMSLLFRIQRHRCNLNKRMKRGAKRILVFYLDDYNSGDLSFRLSLAASFGNDDRPWLFAAFGFYLQKTLPRLFNSGQAELKAIPKSLTVLVPLSLLMCLIKLHVQSGILCCFLWCCDVCRWSWFMGYLAGFQ